MEEIPQPSRDLQKDIFSDAVICSKLLFFLDEPADRLKLASTCKGASSIVKKTLSYYFVPTASPGNDTNQVKIGEAKDDPCCCIIDEITPKANEVFGIMPDPSVGSICCYKNFHDAWNEIKSLYKTHRRRLFIPPVFELVPSSSAFDPHRLNLENKRDGGGIERCMVPLSHFLFSKATVFRFERGQLVAIKPENSDLDYYSIHHGPAAAPAGAGHNPARCIIA